jgi:hypothetical protein
MIDFYGALALLAVWHMLFVVPAPKARALEYGFLLTLGLMFFGLSLYEHTYAAVTALGTYLVGLGLYFNLTVAASVVSVLIAGASLYLFGGVS